MYEKPDASGHSEINISGTKTSDDNLWVVQYIFNLNNKIPLIRNNHEK